jgi:hypothetical protein
MADTILWGCVNGDGTVHSGSGFTVSRSATGTYRISYDTPFSASPAVVLTQNYKLWDDFGYGGGDTRTGCLLVASDATQCKVVTGDENGVHTNRNFSFLAIGPE